jgi:hypothetical protein
MVSSFRPAALKVPESVGPTQAGLLSLAYADIIPFSAPYPRSASVVWAPPPNLNHLLGLLKRKSFPPVRHKEIDPTPLLAHIEPHEIIQYLRGEKKLPRRGGDLPVTTLSAHPVVSSSARILIVPHLRLAGTAYGECAIQRGPHFV